MKKSIAIIRKQYRVDGGAERIIKRILDSLNKISYGFNISIICQQWEGCSDNYRVLKVPKKGFSRYRKHTFFIGAVERAIRNNDFDIIQAHEKISGCHIYRAGDGCHKKWLSIKIEKSNFFKKFLLRKDFFHKSMLQAEEDLLKHSNLHKVVCISQQGEKELKENYPFLTSDKIQVIYNGIDIQKYNLSSFSEKQRMRKQERISDYPTVIFVGSGFERKGLVVLLEALALTEKWQLLVVGKDKKEKLFKKKCQQLNIESRVTFAGVQKDVENWYHMADVLVHPAWYEPFGNVVLEAMACGLPVIVSDRCGAQDLVEQGENGYVFRESDVQQLADYLIAHEKLERLPAMGKHARKTAEKYPIERMVKEFSALYDEILQQKETQSLHKL